MIRTYLCAKQYNNTSHDTDNRAHTAGDHTAGERDDSAGERDDSADDQSANQHATANPEVGIHQRRQATTARATARATARRANSQQPTANSQQPTAEPTEDLKAQLAALQARLDAIESQRTTETRTAEVERIIAPLSDTLKAVYRRTPFATLTDEEYTQLTETIRKEVTELASADKARGAVFSRPTASRPTDGKASDKETEEVLRRLNL